MILTDNETEMLSFALCEYQELVDRVKRIKRKLVDAVSAPGTDKENLDKIRDELFSEYGLVEGIDRAVTDGMTYLESEPMCELIDNVKKSCSGMPFQVENRVMNPVSFYYNFKLVGIARNRESYLATLKQIADKKLTGCTALIGEELITITENGELVHEPKDGPVIPEDTMEYLHWKRGVV